MSKTKWYTKPIYAMVALALVLSVGITALPTGGIVEASCAQTVWVDDTGPSCPDTGSGTQADPYCRIHDGVDAVCEGGTVHVLPGKYDGGINVNKTNVTIKSTDGPEVTVVDPAACSGFEVIIVDPAGCNGFEVTAEGVTIDGFKITGFGRVLEGPSPEGTGHSPQINYNYSGYGVHLFCGANNCIIKNNIIENNRHGIGIETDNNQILYNNILNNIAVLPSGIHIGSYASGNEIHCNNIEGNLAYGVFKEGYDNLNGVSKVDRGNVDATNNWWGCSEGPGAAGCDTVSGNVLFDPWLPTQFEYCEVCGGARPPPKVPTTNHWGIVAMTALFAGLLVWTVRRRRVAS